jgi:dipeptidyl aminopeptidase/acylaminoacyl peptidase
VKNQLFAAAAAVLVAAPPAAATFPGEPGPIAFQRFVDPEDEESVQIFSIARPGAKARKLTTGGSGYNPDYSPDGQQIAFERRFGGVRPDAIVTMRSDGSSPALVQTTCIADPCLGDNSPAWSPDGSRFVFERAFGPIINDEASGGLDLVTASADRSGERLILDTTANACGRPPSGPSPTFSRTGDHDEAA